MKNIDLNLLYAFDALFDERSVTRAARRLLLTQPAVSNMLRRLRRTFSDDLFVRTSHGILPTPRAEELAEPIKNLIRSAEALGNPDSFDPLSSEATFRLCGSDYLQSSILGPLVTDLRTSAPKVRVSLLPRPPSGLPDLLARGEFDICVSVSEVAIPDFPARRLYRDRYVCVARREHPLKAGAISMRQLCSYDHIFVDPTGNRLSGPIDEALDALGYRRRVAAAVPSFPVLFDILRSDDLIAFVPERLLQSYGPDLKSFRTDIESPEIEIVANWHPRMSGDPGHKWLRDRLVHVAKKWAGRKRTASKSNRRQ